jgi:hypothetical protein
MRSLLTYSSWVACALIAPTVAPGQVKFPKPPDNYDVQVRYRILADRNERVLQYEAFTKFLGGIGFKETDNDESDQAPFDPNAQLISGVIPSRTARDLLKDARVQTILLAPAGYKLPDDPQQRVRVSIELAPSRDQLALSNQTEIALSKLGFKRDLGFDTRKFTLLRGTVPASNLPKLLRDLRYQPSGWLLPETSPELYAVLRDGAPTPELVRPFGEMVPVRVVEVLGGTEAAPAVVVLPPIPADQPQLAKFTADLRRRLAEEGAREKPLRLEVVLANAPIGDDRDWRIPLKAAGATVEGRVGPVVTVLVAQGARAANVALLSEVSSVRLPRVSSSITGDLPAPKADEPKEDKKENLVSTADEPKLPRPASALKPPPLPRDDAADRKGQGVRVVVIDTDFAGWEQNLAGPAKDSKPAPKTTFIDLTAERNADIRPDAMPGTLGHGTRCALAVRLGAPMAELLLVRIPVDAPYHVVNVGRFVRGDEFRTEGFITRRQEIESEYEAIGNQKRDAQAEYRRAFDNFDDDAAARQRRVAAQKMLQKLEAAEQGLLERMSRVDALEQSLAKLRAAQVVVSLVHWDTGFALDGASAVARFLDDWLTRPKGAYDRHLTRTNSLPPPLWFQPAGDTHGQTWTGLYRDADGNGVMEFAEPDAKLKPGRWSNELNFLAVRRDGQDVIDLPAGAKVRISVQWREPHDPTVPEADYRVPVAPLRLLLVKQRDPSGEKFASDEIDLVAESEGLPARLQIDSTFGVYEHSLELTLPAAGRYAVRLEGRVPAIVRPSTVPTLSSQTVHWELRPRLLVESADGRGRFALADFASENGGVSVPADGRSVVAVGAADRNGKRQPYSAAGAGPQTQLLTKPDLLASDALPSPAGAPPLQGSSLSASWTAGWAARLLSNGMAPASFPRGLGIAPGGLIAVP